MVHGLRRGMRSRRAIASGCRVAGAEFVRKRIWPSHPAVERCCWIGPKERPRGENVVELMEALRKSVGGGAAETAAPKKSTKKRKADGQKEILMPIAGRKQAAAKKPIVKPHRKSA